MDTPVSNKTTESEPTRAAPVVAPPVDIYESEQEFLVYADIPGVRPGEVKVRYEDEELRLEAIHPSSDNEPGVGYRRVFKIPDSVDTNGIDARLNAGVLTLRLPKVTRARPREITVTAG